MCPDGFLLGSDWKTCADVNECENDNMGCHQLCINTPGSYEVCRFVYKIFLILFSSVDVVKGSRYQTLIVKYVLTLMSVQKIIMDAPMGVSIKRGQLSALVLQE